MALDFGLHSPLDKSAKLKSNFKTYYRGRVSGLSRKIYRRTDFSRQVCLKFSDAIYAAAFSNWLSMDFLEGRTFGSVAAG
jgi:hypothetical protein